MANERTSPNPTEILTEDLHKAFGPNHVLRGIDLAIARGDVLAIVGSSGSGKTVLLNLILGQLVPDRGRVLVANHELPGAPLCDIATLADDIDRVHQHWGVVFQRNALFSGNVYDNIALWLAEVRNMAGADILEVSRTVLDSVGLPSDDAFLRQDHAALSGGMAKRLAVARALSMDPKVLFYDEPTTGLDPSNAAQIHELISSTHHRPGTTGEPRTTVIITHDKDLLQRLAPRTVMLFEGKVFFDGGFREFQSARHPVIRPYFDVMPLLHQRPVTS